MIDCYLFEADTGYYCSNPNCQKLEKYTTHIIGKNYHIKKGTEALYMYVGIDGIADVYCGGCIDWVYKRLKPLLNKNLWAFE
jgi:hypothetical protein